MSHGPQFMDVLRGVCVCTCTPQSIPGEYIYMYMYMCLWDCHEHERSELTEGRGCCWVRESGGSCGVSWLRGRHRLSSRAVTSAICSGRQEALGKERGIRREGKRCYC